jgi:hypothetical protein
MTEALPASQSYLLRLWQASNAGTPVWRVSIVNVHSGERRGFADLESLLVFLKEQTGGDARPGHDLLSTAP